MIDGRIKFRHLQTFVEVARQKSVMKTAELLHVSQPAVTKTIRELEGVLGVEVFERELVELQKSTEPKGRQG